MNNYLKYGLVFIGILVVGTAIYFFALPSDNHSVSEHQDAVYTCSMHPEIRSDKPGKCPICGMTLVKKVIESHVVENQSIDNLLKPTDNFVIGNYQTTTAVDTTINSEIKLPGIVAYDPNSAVNIAARISGRIEKMYVHYKFQRINKGQKLFDLYSPELLTEQQNFIYLISNDVDNVSIIKASKQKLLLYGMTESQINALSSSRKVNPRISIYSPAHGIVAGTEKMENTSAPEMSNVGNNTEALNIKEGSYVKKGETVFKLLNTDAVWGVFNIIQGYNSLIKINESIVITSELDKNDSFNAKINFIETQFNATDKSNRIRVYLNNSTLKWPIGLRLQGIVETSPIKGIWLQKEAMVSVGVQKIVFIKKENGFKAIAIKTGKEMDDFVQIVNGLSVKDTIAKNAQYLMDSESFIKTTKNHE
ncbi:efflux RND transporter periplasmic adaptor subunit [Flavobacterium laiguense]|uniref:Heavy metal transporter n=1 Tax=Flavobacterium laiguense TaxID=2169409 RepID=A0A2U1JYU9_9FLAO|nr:efflux RND transporter periplasmic adaptor subunit [Flavobacterium laiguense]PWA10119.1 heavy metal transporter [Flavobacterium laiguense]